MTFTDFHVHLDLVDPATVAAGGLARVLDLGSAVVPTAGDVEVVRAGRMLTAVGGYPSTRPWAAGGLFREVTAHDVDAAVAEQVVSGASVVKIALNRDAGPVWPDDVLAAVVASAHSTGRRVVAHVEGAGEPARALAAGVDALAHAPFSEHLSDEEIAAHAASMIWISTLRIHVDPDRGRALDNVRRFHAAGGCVLYGTDMGNGPATGGVEQDEIGLLRSCGLTDEDITRAMTDDGGLLVAV